LNLLVCHDKVAPMENRIINIKELPFKERANRFETAIQKIAEKLGDHKDDFLSYSRLIVQYHELENEEEKRELMSEKIEPVHDRLRKAVQENGEVRQAFHSTILVMSSCGLLV
jgi:hypothetical protein